MTDQRGAVLPIAMLILVVLSAVLLGLSSLTGQEPLIASNHVMIVQAQALAEAGLERALWALSTPESADGIPWSGTAAAPYDGSAFLGVATESGAMLGGFRLTVSGEGDRQREVTAIGLVPGDVGPLGRARQDITATLIRLRFPAPPAGLAVRGDLTIGDGVTVDASADGSCGDRAGTWSSGVTTAGAGAQVQGRSGDAAIPNEPTDMHQAQPLGAFDALAFSAAELQALKAVARVRGTYYQGAVTFDASRRIPDGVVFVDTGSGQPITDATPVADLAAVTIGDGAAGPGGSFRGWLIVEREPLRRAATSRSRAWPTRQTASARRARPGWWARRWPDTSGARRRVWSTRAPRVMPRWCGAAKRAGPAAVASRNDGW